MSSCTRRSWPHLSKGYLPLPTRLRSSTLERKRGEYQSLVDLTFAKGKDGLDQQIWHQIEIDVPRTRPGVPLWMHSSTQRVRSRHPTSVNLELSSLFAVFRTYTVRLGDTASRQWVCSRDQRPCHAILSSVPLCLCWSVFPVGDGASPSGV